MLYSRMFCCMFYCVYVTVIRVTGGRDVLLYVFCLKSAEIINISWYASRFFKKPRGEGTKHSKQEVENFDETRLKSKK